MGLIRLRAYLRAPVVTSTDIHLDGLLMSAHPACRSVPVSRDVPISAIPRARIPICDLRVHRWRIACASVAQYAPDARLTTVDVVKRRDGLDIEMLAKPVTLAIGPGKNRWTRYTAIVSSWIEWYAIAQRREVIRLANRISHIGQMRSAGNGAVEEWVCEYVEGEDPARVWQHEGIAQRNLPTSVCAAYQQSARGPLEAPFWHPARQVDDVVVAGTRVALADEWVAQLRRVGSADATRAFSVEKQARRTPPQ